MPTARVETTDANFYLVTPYNQNLNADLKLIPTHRWNKERRAWQFDRTAAVARRLRQCLVDHRYEINGGEVLVMRSKPLPTTLKHRDPQPWPHQIEGIKMIGEGMAVCIDGGMGTGKTRMVIDAMANYELKRVLILCPSSVVSVWPTEVAKYAGDDIRVIALRDGTIQKRTDRADLGFDVVHRGPGHPHQAEDGEWIEGENVAELDLLGRVIADGADQPLPDVPDAEDGVQACLAQRQSVA